jgi:hypothetical protein
MDPMIDIDQELAAAMQVEPGADFAARVRTRIATDPAPSGFQVPMLALGAIGCVALIAVIATVMTMRPDRTTLPPLLAARHDMPTTVLRSAVRAVSAAITVPKPSIAVRNSNVIVSRSEMLALQRLLSGAIVMPPALEPPSDAPELSIPAISLDPIPVLPGPSGERQ